jgi:D-alanyl-D-alanine dipeptidase
MPETKRLKTREPMRALNHVPLRESGEPLVDLRRHCPGIRISRRCMPFLRETVAGMLRRANAALPEGLRLWVRTALRTLDMQRDAYGSYFSRLQELHPDWGYATLRRATNRYFAPPDERAPPGHCTGGAVDVWVLLPSGKPLDLTSPFGPWEAPGTFVEGLSPRAHANRMLLHETMLSAGFSNCEEEYWHYSYGDAAWAVRTGAPACIYGLVEPPDAWLERRPDKRWPRK